MKTANIKTRIISPSDLNLGDTVMIDGKMFTIGKNCITKSFFGTLVRGQQFKNGIEQVLFPKWFKGELIGYRPQI